MSCDVVVSNKNNPDEPCCALPELLNEDTRHTSASDMMDTLISHIEERARARTEISCLSPEAVLQPEEQRIETSVACYNCKWYDMMILIYTT